MNLVSKEFVVDEHTFQPMLRVTIDLPIGPASADTSTADKFKEMGENFVEMMKASVN